MKYKNDNVKRNYGGTQRPPFPQTESQHNIFKVLCCGNFSQHNNLKLLCSEKLPQHNILKLLCSDSSHNTTVLNWLEIIARQQINIVVLW